MKINHILMTAILSLSLVTGATMAVAPATSAAQIIVAQSPTETPPTLAPFTATPGAKGSQLNRVPVWCSRRREQKLGL